MNNQRQVAKSNFKKTQKTTARKSTKLKTQTRRTARARAAPGSKGGGEYFRIVVRPKARFVTFRIQDVGEKGRIQRLAGKEPSGSWNTQAWLVSKSEAHVDRNKLVADSQDVKDLFAELRSDPTKIKADIFAAKDRRAIAEREIPRAIRKRAGK